MPYHNEDAPDFLDHDTPDNVDDQHHVDHLTPEQQLLHDIFTNEHDFHHLDDEHDDVTLEHLISLHHQLDTAPIDQYLTVLHQCLDALDRAHPAVVTAFARHRHARTSQDR